jgi:hypothetical protein
MVTAALAFFTSLLCAMSIAIIELFHMIHTKQLNGIVFWKAVDACVDRMQDPVDSADPTLEDMV